MLYDANLESLKRCVRNTEKAPDFDLSLYVHPCGTFGCLVGNDFLNVMPNGALYENRSGGLLSWGIKAYSLNATLYWFLFGAQNYGKSWRGIDANVPETYRNCLNREAALNRLRKTIQYIERKRAIWYEADGRISERARKQDGDWGVCASVMQSIAVSA